MNELLTPRTRMNMQLRLWAGAVLIAAQCLAMTAGCVSGGEAAAGGAQNQDAPDGDAPDGDRSGGDGSGGDGAGGAGNGDGGGATTVDDLVAAWAVARGRLADAAWGVAYGASAVDDELSLQVFLDGEAGVAGLTLALNGGALNGTWTAADGSGSFSGTLNAAGDEITGTLSFGGDDYPLTLYRGGRATSAANGVWTRLADGRTAILAADLDAVLVSVLNGSDWPADDGRYDGAYAAGGAEVLQEAFSFTGGGGVAGGEGLFFDGGTKLVLVDRQNGGTLVPAATRFDRTDDAGNRTGLWVGLDRQYAGDLPIRNIRRVIEHDGALFVHEGGQTLGASLERTLRLTVEGDGYADDTPGSEWAGELAGSGNRLVGEWVGFDGWYQSMDRTAAPTPAELTGTFGSLDINRQFSDIEPIYGSATLEFDGTTLTVTDVGSDGNTYQMSATWQGDHFEGQWWDAADPTAKSPWRGQWLAGGGLLHGMWNEGEWSFAAAAIANTTDLSDAEVAYVADPAADRILTVADQIDGYGLTLLRDQQRITHMVYATGTEEVTVAVDERMRPTQMVGAAETIDIVWADNGRDMTVTVTDHDTLAEQTYDATADFSDENMVALFAAQEAALGRDFSPVRQWLADHPGELEQIATTGMMTVADAASKPLARTQSRSEQFRVDLSDYVAVNNAALQGSAYVLGVASVLSGLGAGATVVAVVSIAAAALALVVVAAALVDLLWWLFSDGDCCTPCGLGCFFNCCWD